MIQTPQRILISRTDNLGDVVLTLPLAKWLKQHWPQVTIMFLCRPYAAAIVQACPDVDDVVTWSADQSDQQVCQSLQALQVDMILHVFPNRQIARCARRIKIAQRVGTRRRWYQWLTCNHRPNFSRAHSAAHEAQLNFKLLAALGLAPVPSMESLQQATYLEPSAEQQASIAHWIDPQRFTLLLHPLSNGHARDWPLSHYIALYQRLDPAQYQVLLNGVPAEQARMAELAEKIPAAQHLFDLTLAEKVALFAQCDGMVVGSTGPLHIAAALGIPVLGLFPPKKRINPQRWGPIGPRARYLVHSHICEAACTQNECACMQALSVNQVLSIITQWQHEGSNE